MQADFTASLWATAGPTPWYFLTLPEELSDDIDDRTRGRQGGFGSVRVEVTLGSTTWRTSIFPSREHAAYLLPVKRAVRDAEGLVLGGATEVAIRVLDPSSAG